MTVTYLIKKLDIKRKKRCFHFMQKELQNLKFNMLNNGMLKHIISQPIYANSHLINSTRDLKGPRVDSPMSQFISNSD